jgi:hypothetical protein
MQYRTHNLQTCDCEPDIEEIWTHKMCSTHVLGQ